MPNATNPRRIVAACDRLTEVMAREFDDLNPAEVHFVYAQLMWTHNFGFDLAMREHRPAKSNVHPIREDH